MQAFLFIVAAAHASAAVAREHPAVKIINLLQKLQAQIKEEGEMETNAYGKFTYWCGEVIKEQEGIIKKSTQEISVAEASIEALTEDIAALESEIAQLTKDLETDESQKANAEKLRGEANTLYGTNKGDLEATIAAVGDAITALQDSKPAMIQSDAVQAKVQAALAYADIFLPEKKAEKAVAFLAAEPITSENAEKFAGRTGRERTYDFKGGDIIEMLKSLKLDFEDQLVELNKAETAATSAHKLADAAKEDEINAATRAKDSKTEIKGQKGEDLSSAQSDLDSATEVRNAAKTELETTQQKCRTRADEYDQRMKTRAGETAAMSQAIEVLEKITGTRTPESKGISLLQKGSKKISAPVTAIVNLLRKAGNTKSTAALSKLADKIAALKQTPGSGTFDQIKNMIQKMIFHLMSEQKDEDDHKNWCDKEVDQTTMMKEDKEKKRDELQAAMDQLTAEIEKLTTSISDNTALVASMEAEIEEATAGRAEEKAENAATIKDAQEAQTAISQAIAVLEDFYKSTGEVEKEAWEFVQLKVVRRARAEPEPELWEGGEGGAYKGTGGGSDVIGLLEEIASDFASMEAQAKADETTQQNEYDEWLTATQIDKSATEKDSEMKSARKERLSEKLESKTADFTHNKKELEATEQYWQDLHHACIDGDSTYEDRKAARTQEIEALREAQKILENAFNEPEEEGPPEEGSPAP